MFNNQTTRAPKRRRSTPRLLPVSVAALATALAVSLLGAPVAHADRALEDQMISVARGPGGLEFTPDGARAYVTHTLDNQVTVIDTATHSVETTIDIGMSSMQLAVSPDGDRAYVSTLGYGILVVIDTKTNTVVEDIPIGGTLYGVSVTPDSSRVYVANSHGSVAVIDAGTNTVLKTIITGGAPLDVAISSDGTRAYATTGAAKNTLEVIDTASMEIIGSHPVTSPGRLALTPDGTQAYIIGLGRTYYAMDLATGDLTSFQTDGRINKAFDVDVTPDGSRAYIAAQGDPVYAVDTATNTIVAKTKLASAPWFLAVSPTGKLAYVASQSQNTVTPLVIETAPTVSGDAPNGIVGQDYRHQFDVTGNPAATVTTDGELPPGLTLSADGLLSGTPTEVGTHTFTIHAANGIAPGDAFEVTIEILEASLEPGGCDIGSLGSAGSLGSMGSLGSLGSAGSMGSAC